MLNTRPKPKANFKILIAVLCIAVAIVIAFIAASAAFVIDISVYDTGVVRYISVFTKQENELELNMLYFLPMGGYSVHDVPLDEGQYIGDGMIDYNGALGKYRIMVDFGDIAPHYSIVRKADKDGIFVLKSSTVSLKAKIAYPSDHGFVLYIGSDMPISVESKQVNDIKGPCGIISIPITVGGVG